MSSSEPNFPGGLWTIVDARRVNHPLVDSSAHAHITSYVSRTVLTQTFASNVSSAAQTHYSFPLYDGISVISFSCDIDGKSIHGIVKEKQAARQDYNSAVSRGHDAALLELSQSEGDVYTISVGTVAVGATVKVTIEYVGELRHDAESNGLRFTIPTHISARYGLSTDGALGRNQPNGPFKLTVDTQLAPGSEIKSINSPSHPVIVNIGSISTESGPSITTRSNPSKASVLCHLANPTLDKDFVLNITATKLGEPMALLERHPTIPDEAALMVTLTPHFSLPLLKRAEQPEIVFMCDRSGSMVGASIEGVRSSLRVFLKSLPVGAKFNICSFGSNYSMLWPKSKSYDNESFNEASLLVQNLQADMGGTNMYKALEAIFRQKSPQTTLDVIVLTDGQISAQDHLFGLIRDTVQSSNGTVRVFSIGIGSDASSSLVEGIARNGNGFSQSVADGEAMDRKIMRMLKGALSVRIYDVTLELVYKRDLDCSVRTSSSDDDEDFEVVDGDSDCLIIEAADESDNARKDEPQHRDPVLIYDPAADVDEPALESLDRDSDDTTAPELPVPPIIQAPAVIPSLFSSTRVSAYLLLSGTAAQRTPESIVMRASSLHGPLEQIIPVAVLDQASETIHQLAARKAVQELEDGLGWLHQAKDTTGTPLHAKYHDKFDDIVQRELVRLGVKYQISGKHTSFVAMEEREDHSSAEIKDDLSRLPAPPTGMRVLPRIQLRKMSCCSIDDRQVPRCSESIDSRVLVSSASPRSYCHSEGFSSMSTQSVRRLSLTALSRRRQQLPARRDPSILDDTSEQSIRLDRSPLPLPVLGLDNSFRVSEVPVPKPESVKSDLDIIINAAEICGSWEPEPRLMEILGTTVDELSRKTPGVSDSRILVTAAVIDWLEKEAAGKREIWELLVDKARSWLASRGYPAQE